MTFAIELPAPGVLEADVYDLAGRRVRVLARGPAGGGVRVLEWDGRDEHGAEAAPGLYFARVRFGAEVRVARLVRIR
jgi:flagellar hook assembly protein FlgD